MTTQHTPGPWSVEIEEWTRGSAGGDNLAVCAPGAGVLAIITGKADDDDAKADAAVMAAAPLMLQALKDLRAQLRAAVKMDVRKHYSLMVADAAAGTAIHKAEGGQI